MRSATAKTLAHALGGQRAGACWMARCPAHDDGTASLAIRDGDAGQVLVHCHAGCSQAAVIAALRARGLWDRHERMAAQPSQMAAHVGEGVDKASTAKALRIWCESKPALGTLVEAYLRSRCITIAAPPSLRFHPSLWHSAGITLPAMTGLVATGDGNRPIGIHRTWISPDGCGKAAIEGNKKLLGPSRGGAVRLGPVASPLLIGEGIETSLSAMQATGHPAWAALSTSGMRALVLPRDVREVIILADGDPPGEVAARSAAARWAAEGRSVRIARAPEGHDFNDLLVGSARNSGGRDVG